MPEILEIDGDTVLIDGESIDFAGGTSNAQITQANFISVLQPLPSPSKITQAVSISVQNPPSSPAQILQGVIISVVQNNRKSISLGDPIKLNCWQPCAVYGTFATIVYLGE